MKWLALFLFGGAGAGILVGGLLWGLRRYALFSEGRRAQGRVVAQEEHRSERREDGRDAVELSYYPIIEFEALGGEKVRFTGSTGGGGKPLLETGARVEVVYDPSHPQNAQAVTFSQFWLGPLTLSIFGAVFLAMGVASFFLIAGSDRALGPSFQRRVDRDMLRFRTDAIRLEARVGDLRPDPEGGGGRVVVCRARRTPGGPLEEFVSEGVPEEFGPEFLDRTVTVLVDPDDPNRYLVDLDPLLSEVLRRRGT